MKKLLVAIMFTGTIMGLNAQNKIDSTGNVGIGTTSPDEPLHVIGNVKLESNTGSFYLRPNSTLSNVKGHFIGTYTAGTNLPLIFRVGAANRLYMGTNGNIGINTVSPSELLDIEKNHNGRTRLEIKNASTGTGQETSLSLMSDGVGFDILSYNSVRPENLMGLPRAKGVFLRTHQGSPAARLAIGTGSAAPLHLATADQVRMTIKDNGLIGIGTTSVDSKLHIYNGNSGAEPHTFTDLTIEDDDNGMLSMITPNNKIGYFGFADPEDSYVGGIQYEHSSDRMIFRVNNHSNDMTIASNGFIGIGTDNPGQFLDVRKHHNSTTRVQIVNENTGAAQETGMTLRSKDVGFDILSYNVARSGNLMGLPRSKSVFLRTHQGSPADRFAIGTGSAAPLHFGTSDQVRMTVAANGKVGIGTTIPDKELTVDGTIHASEVIVDLNIPGPDYVFESDYELMPLSEVEEFITINKHLPEVPKASIMEEEGVNINEMNMLLLKKVEELTLHLIEQNKKIE